MPRFVSIEKYDGKIIILTEEDNYIEEINAGCTACWVWQEAETAEQAEEQHYRKLEAWENDPTKDTY